MLAPDETQLDGSWIFKDGRAYADAVALRIRELTENVLTRICADWSGWSTLYRDPQDGRFWELIYLHGESHGGVSPSLHIVEKSNLDAPKASRFPPAKPKIYFAVTRPWAGVLADFAARTFSDSQFGQRSTAG